ncbi:helix-turn-helix domain-containing protein [Streptomyces sp. NBS 14/10]|uniref:helix-turn-helix domain-containing protein n=1 Tax=Streptomyces sp. NBS 14/10 TaxID=1945643 RepID=UPI000B9CB6AA|nr:helix-turn-helix domain-containing protein [Streptomyces sp. NBS 14/10]KAK1185508.1 helix-turn-helix domain-containing protein [Streptomyces sp. NBS 14/10]NUS84370.1 helix-turn-helix domain-containing protein [Streptomyces sp.]
MSDIGHTEPRIGGPGRNFYVDVTAPSTARDGFDVFRREWESQIGEALPLPPLEPLGSDGFRVSVRASKVHDTVIAGLYGESMAGGTRGASHHLDDRVLVHVMERGAWRFVRPRNRGETSIPAGQFIVRHNGPPARFEVEPRTTAKILILPASQLRPLIRDRATVGPADLPELRLLTAYAKIVEANLDDLTAVGVRAARNSLIELVKGVLMQAFDDTEPLLAPALAQAARDIVDSRLTDPDLSPAALARELKVSVRTLHRAFAEAEESVTAYIRRRRLEQARLELAAPAGRPSVSELAAHWHFADSSHFIRAFKKEYGRTPAEYARSSQDLSLGRSTGRARRPLSR